MKQHLRRRRSRSARYRVVALEPLECRLVLADATILFDPLHSPPTHICRGETVDIGVQFQLNGSAGSPPYDVVKLGLYDDDVVFDDPLAIKEDYHSLDELGTYYNHLFKNVDIWQDSYLEGQSIELYGYVKIDDNAGLFNATAYTVKQPVFLYNVDVAQCFGGAAETSLDFGTGSEPQSIRLYNQSGQSVLYDLQWSAPWLNVESESGSDAAAPAIFEEGKVYDFESGNTLNLTIDRDAFPVGSHSTTLSVVPQQAGFPTLTFDVHAEWNPPPKFYNSHLEWQLNNGWSPGRTVSERTVAVNWSGAFDTNNGSLTGYKSIWNNSSSIEVAAFKQLTLQPESEGKGSEAYVVPHSGEWWFHAIYQDDGGALSEPVTAGPFRIDFDGPDPFELYDCLDPGGVFDSTPNVCWKPASDPHSGLAEYKVTFRNEIAQSEHTIPLNASQFPVNAFKLQLTDRDFNGLELGLGTWAWEVVAIDQAGNPTLVKSDRTFERRAEVTDLYWADIDGNKLDAQTFLPNLTEVQLVAETRGYTLDTVLEASVYDDTIDMFQPYWLSDELIAQDSLYDSSVPLEYRNSGDATTWSGQLELKWQAEPPDQEMFNMSVVGAPEYYFTMPDLAGGQWAGSQTSDPVVVLQGSAWHTTQSNSNQVTPKDPNLNVDISPSNAPAGMTLANVTYEIAITPSENGTDCTDALNVSFNSPGSLGAKETIKCDEFPFTIGFGRNDFAGSFDQASEDRLFGEWGVHFDGNVDLSASLTVTLTYFSDLKQNNNDKGVLKTSAHDYPEATTANDNVIVLVHGWNPDKVVGEGKSFKEIYHDHTADDENEWKLLADQLTAALTLYQQDWTLLHYDWSLDAATGPNSALEVKSRDARPPLQARDAAVAHGYYLAKAIEDLNASINNVHFIAHSAGSWAAIEAARQLKSESSQTSVQTTFLDPFISDNWFPCLIASCPGTKTERHFEEAASFANDQENYYVVDDRLGDDQSDKIAYWTSGDYASFNGKFDRNTNLTLLNFLNPVPLYDPFTMLNHAGPIRWYAKTVENYLQGGDLVYPAGSDDRIGFHNSIFAREANTANRPPAVSIDSVDTQNGIVTLLGSASDEDGSIVEDVWTSNLNKKLGSGPSLEIAEKEWAVGIHSITYRASDNQGKSRAAQTTLEIPNAMPTVTWSGVPSTSVTPGSDLTIWLDADDHDEDWKGIVDTKLYINQSTASDACLGTHIEAKLGVNLLQAPTTPGDYNLCFVATDDEGFTATITSPLIVGERAVSSIESNIPEILRVGDVVAAAFTASDVDARARVSGELFLSGTKIGYVVASDVNFTVPDTPGNHVLNFYGFSTFGSTATWSQSVIVAPHTLSVSTLRDELDDDYSAGDMSLREAIQLAKILPEPAIIGFSETTSRGGVSQFLLRDGPFEIDFPLEISGSESHETVLHGLNQQKIFAVSPTGELSLANMTLSGGSPGIPEGDRACHESGGAISNEGILRLEGTSFRENGAYSCYGGAIANLGQLQIVDSMFSGNESWISGSAIHNSGDLTIANSVFTRNNGDQRGTLANEGAAASASIARSYFTANAAERGGAIYNTGVVEIDHSVFAENRVTGRGGAILSESGNLTLSSSTIIGNSALATGGVYSDATVTSITNTVIAGNPAAIDNDLAAEQLQVSENNFVGTVNGDAKLTSFTGTREGEVWYYPQINSPLIDAGNDASLVNSTLDLLGNPRILGSMVDIGAVEFTDAPQLSLNLEQLSIVEGDTYHGTVSLTAAPTLPVSVSISLDGANPDAFDASEGTIQFDTNNWYLPQSFSINHLVDSDKKNQTATVSFAADGMNTKTVRLTGIDDDFHEYVVTSTEDSIADDGVTTLREAILAANANTAVNVIPAGGEGLPDVIRFDSQLFASGPATIELAQGELVITDDLIIDGPGTEQLSIDGLGQSRVILVEGGTTAEIASLTIRRGHVPVTDDLPLGQDGGGIGNRGTLTLRDMLVTDSSASSTGGGIGNDYGATLFIIDSRIVANQANNSGGGISNGGELYAENTVIESNIARDGGGLVNDGVLFADSISVEANLAYADGGGLWNIGFLLYLTNSTVVGNVAAGAGGGIENNNEPANGLTIANSTIAGNVADNGGGISSRDWDSALQSYVDAPIILQNSIVAFNHVSGDNSDFAGTLSSASGNNLLGIDAGFVRPADPGVDTEWGTADDIPGDYHLLDTSPAIDAGDNTFLTSTWVSAVKNTRTIHDGDGDGVAVVDIGAFEFVALSWQNIVHPSDVNNDGEVTASDALLIINELGRISVFDPSTGRLKDPIELPAWPGVYYDQNGDGYITAFDALRVINELARINAATRSNSEQVDAVMSDWLSRKERDESEYDLYFDVENEIHVRL